MSRSKSKASPWELHNRPAAPALTILLVCALACALAWFWQFRVSVPEDTAAPAGVQSSVRLNELMSSNKSALMDNRGEYSDWIELMNSGKKDFDLSGWILSQDALGESAWRFSEGTVLRAGERLLLLCDGINGPDFSLDSKGEGLYLSAPDGTPAWSKNWERMDDDCALTLDEENGEYIISTEASPGYPNTPEGTQAAQIAQDISGELVINELQCSNYRYHRQTDGEYYDWLELYNGTGSHQYRCINRNIG